MGRTTKKDATQKKEYAKTLFIHGNYTQKEIADKTGVTEKTIGVWKEEGKWETLQASVIMSKEQQLKRLYAQISEINTAIEKKPEGERYANSKEADTIMKLTKSAKELEGEMGLSEVINVFIGFTSWLKNIDFDASVLLHKYEGRYLKSLIK